MSDSETIEEMLATAKTIAVVGMSDKTWRASHNIGRYLAEHGYTVFPVNPALKEILGKLATSIEGGSTFSEALAQHPKVFNRLFVNMVKAGELGGVL